MKNNYRYEHQVGSFWLRPNSRPGHPDCKPSTKLNRVILDSWK